MHLKIVTEAPFWFVVFCLLAGVGYAFFLYYRETRFKDSPLWLRRTMALLRFSSVSLISFLLLSPLLKTVFREVEKPVIVIAQDNSESIVVGKDSTFYRTTYKKNLANLSDELSSKYDVRMYSFGEKLKEVPPGSAGTELNFTEKETDMASFFAEMDTRYSNRNLGAIVFASDGLYNKGQNPVFSSSHIKAPVFTIALGDTNVKRDLILKKVISNKLAYLGNKFPLEIAVNAKQCQGMATTLTVSKGETTLFSQRIELNQTNFNISIPVQLEAKEPGLQRYRVRLSVVPGEISVANNAQDVFIEVLDGREKVLILCDAPHPDVAALKQSIENNQNYEAEVSTLKDFDKKLIGYNLILLYQLPSVNATSKLVSEAVNSDIPLLFIVGNQTHIRNFNSLQTGLMINPLGNRFNEPQPVLDDHFPLFTLSDAAKNYLSRFPALQSPFGSYRASASAIPLLYQLIGTVKTKDPLMVFSQIGSKKTAVLAGEGLWRWRLQDYLDHGNHDIFNELIDKTIQYLAVKQNKSQFRIVSKGTFPENQALEMEAEVYNESYELINSPEVNLEIQNEKGRKFPFSFSKTSNAYRLNAGLFPAGEYTYLAKTKLGEKVFTQKGSFSITTLMLEAGNTTADHQLLYSLATKHNGELVYPAQMNGLAAKIAARDDIRPVIYNPKKLVDLVELKTVFFLLLILLSAEWFMRKRNGAY